MFNVVHGDKVAVDRILEHPDIASVSFVGSTPVARYIYENGTKAGKRVQALGGAKNHMIVLPDADIDMAADAAVSAAYGSAGERCMAISVVVAVGDVAEPLVDAIKAAAAQDQGRARRRTRTPRWGRSSPASTATRWRRTSRAARRRVRTWWWTAASTRCTRTARASSWACRCWTRSGPTWTATRTRSSARCWRSSARTPTPMRSSIIHDNPYANGTAIFTRDGGAARQFQFDIGVGMVGINVPIPVPVAYYSFGGWKSSLFGDLHMYGPEGVQFYTRAKVVTARWPDPGTQQGRSRLPAHPLSAPHIRRRQCPTRTRGLPPSAS